MAAKIEEYKTQLNSALNDSSKPWKAALDFAEEKTNVPRLYLFAGGLGAVVLYLVLGSAAQLLCNIISVLYPAYISIKAIESSSKADDTKWLTYWVMYAIFSLVEYFSVFLYQFIPFYFLLKCVFFIWCMLPIENNGAVVVYHRFVRPYFLKHQSSADDAIDKLTGKAKDIVSDVFNKAK